MVAALAMLAMAAAAAPAVPMDAARLAPGNTCYAIEVKGKVVGSTWQSIHAGDQKGRLTWDITIHQVHSGGGFDMRDHFVVDRSTLRPISMESDRGKDKSEKGWHRIRLTYTDNGVTGTRETAAGTEPIHVVFDHPVWEGNLWGVTFASLPLREGAVFFVPTWQYDKGLGNFTVKVVGREIVHAEKGDIQAWHLEAGDSPEQLVHYSIALNPRQELGYEAGAFRQRLGGSCSPAGSTDSPR
ncbi:hypothetical protein L2Y96_19000 [Luteibacter aegosomaticola]|uniref:DUF3108 domain-containing protein n=1 Tax=Luteibacter aegosomaticola TaxID=2911538 RepID=UPI001FFBE262|nr:hypothetical protein [Luteibacter aegosomaticola]UPG89460.1 hypothetical protein L2Y96_19000 [Luteibacter aegosomaticola]